MQQLGGILHTCKCCMYGGPDCVKYAVVQGCCSAGVLWCRGAAVQGCCSAGVLQCRGAAVQGCCSAGVLQCRGAVVQWCGWEFLIHSLKITLKLIDIGVVSKLKEARRTKWDTKSQVQIRHLVPAVFQTGSKPIKIQYERWNLVT